MLYLWMLWGLYAPRSLRREEGQGLVEYALIIALVAILLVAALLAVKDRLILSYQSIVDALNGTA